MAADVEESFAFGPFRLDPADQRLSCNGRAIPLTPKTFALLVVLVRNHGRLVEKDDLLQQLWPGTFVDEASISRNVSVLRKALADDGPEHRYIETVPKRGYRFVGKIQKHEIARNDGTRDDGAKDIGTRYEPTAPPVASHHARSLATAGVSTAALIAGAVLGAVLYGALAHRAVDAGELGPPAPAHTQQTFTGLESHPAISPDGSMIAYVSKGSADRSLVVRELGGGAPITVFRAPEIGRVRWSPDGNTLLLFARGDGMNGIYTVSRVGGEPRRIAGGVFEACWSPDGTTIALALFVAKKIGFYNVSTGERRSISLDGHHGFIYDLDWSPAAGSIAFVSDDLQGRFRIWTIQPDGAGLQRVFDGNAEIRTARWSIDGRALIFSRRADQTVSIVKLMVHGADTDAAPTPLATGLESDGVFALSADGRRLVYARGPYYSNLWRLDIRGEGASARVSRKQLTDGTSLVERPSISPDGRSIVFNAGQESRADLYTMPIDGGTPKPLTSFAAFSVGGVWSADGKRVAFASTQGGAKRVWTVDLAGGPLRVVSADPISESFELAWGPRSELLILQPGNHDYLVVDAETARPRSRLLGDAAIGWVASVAISPDGRRIAVAWNRPKERGLWLIDRATGQMTRILDSILPLLLGWSPDGASIYAIDGKGVYRGVSAKFGETTTHATLLRIPVEGSPVRTVLALPFDEVGGISISPDGGTIVCAVYTSRSDVWTLDHFDR